MNKIVKDSFVVVSDFHANRWPLDEKIEKYYLNEYDQIFILGDATDRGIGWRGAGGIQLLFDIKALCEKYPGRVHYVPGNHDDFVYDYIINGSSIAKMLMEGNCGGETLEDIDELMKTNPSKIKELAEWLGRQPLQVTHEYKGQKYALAHALFDKKIYEQNPNFGLKDMTRSFYDLPLEKHIIWFRKEKDKYDPSIIPSSDYIMVVGHTPEDHRPDDINLINSDNEEVKVICVDSGRILGREMHKFDGKSKVIPTWLDKHNDTSDKETQPVKAKKPFKIFSSVLTNDSRPKKQEAPKVAKKVEEPKVAKRVEEPKVAKKVETNESQKQKKLLEQFFLKLEKEALDEVIIESIKANSSIYDIVNALVYGNLEGLPLNPEIREKAKIVNENAIDKLLGEIELEHPEYREGNKETILLNHIYEVGFNYVIDSLITYYNETGRINPVAFTIKQISGYLESNDSAYITRQKDARTAASKLGKQGFDRILGFNRCDIRDYIIQRVTVTELIK